MCMEKSTHGSAQEHHGPRIHKLPSNCSRTGLQTCPRSLKEVCGSAGRHMCRMLYVCCKFHEEGRAAYLYPISYNSCALLLVCISCCTPPIPNTYPTNSWSISMWWPHFEFPYQPTPTEECPATKFTQTAMSEPQSTF